MDPAQGEKGLLAVFRLTRGFGLSESAPVDQKFCIRGMDFAAILRSGSPCIAYRHNLGLSFTMVPGLRGNGSSQNVNQAD